MATQNVFHTFRDEAGVIVPSPGATANEIDTNGDDVDPPNFGPYSTTGDANGLWDLDVERSTLFRFDESGPTTTRRRYVYISSGAGPTDYDTIGDYDLDGLVTVADSEGINGHYGVPEAEYTGTTTLAHGANFDVFFPFTVSRRDRTVGGVRAEVTVGPVSNATLYLGLYETDPALEPTTLVAETSVAVGTGSTGVKLGAAGLAADLTITQRYYMLVLNSSVTMTYRTLTGGRIGYTSALATAMGASPLIAYFYAARTAGAFVSPYVAGTPTRQPFGYGWASSLFVDWLDTT